MSHYLDEAINSLKEHACVTKEDGTLLVRGPSGVSRIVKRRVYFFEIASPKAEEHFDFKTQREAMLAGLEWAVKGKI